MKRRSHRSDKLQSTGSILQPVRHFTTVIPPRWRGAVLLAATILLFPLVVGAMIFEAVAKDIAQA
jgi:hypothetical protein